MTRDEAHKNAQCRVVEIQKTHVVLRIGGHYAVRTVDQVSPDDPRIETVYLWEKIR